MSVPLHADMLKSAQSMHNSILQLSAVVYLGQAQDTGVHHLLIEVGVVQRITSISQAQTSGIRGEPAQR